MSAEVDHLFKPLHRMVSVKQDHDYESMFVKQWIEVCIEKIVKNRCKEPCQWQV